MGQTVHLSKLG